ncbi:MAG: hypothetical protein LBR82_06490 [Desulfovibrio sp.]|nr:hypothetical protein [Desulfovibrio sp.]
MKVTRMSPEGWTTRLSELTDKDRLKFCFMIALAAGVKVNLFEDLFRKESVEADEDEEEYEEEYEEEDKIRLSHENTGIERAFTPDEFLAMTVGEYIALCQLLAGEE